MKGRVYSVYVGRKAGEIVYVGTTVQNPEDRYRWHKANGKDLQFNVLSQYDNPEEMLAEERRLIDLHKPKLNKRLKQNFNVKLTAEQLEARKGDASWCQSCLKRHVNKGYTKCMYCS